MLNDAFLPETVFLQMSTLHSYDVTKPFKINSPHPPAAHALLFHLSSPGVEIIRSTLDYKST